MRDKICKIDMLGLFQSVNNKDLLQFSDLIQIK